MMTRNINRFGRELLCAAMLAVVAIGTAHAQESISEREERALQAAVERAAPAVVRIETVGGLERLGRMLVGTGPTTGLVVSSDGYIVSSAFNFAQKPDSILVTLPGGKRHAAKLVATDHSRMVVLLKVDVEDELVPAEPVPIGEMHVGQWALAVGRTFEAERPNVSMGIVSALDRIWGKAIQTDAKVSPNNYGGPLVDITGRVLGVLVPMSPQGSGDVAGVEWYDSGIGFAIPLETVLQVLPQMKQGQDLYQGLLGISLKGDDLFGTQPVIAAAAATAPAFKAGLRAGDKIVELAGQTIERQAQLKHALGPKYAGEKVQVIALRGDERIVREIELIDKVDPYVTPFLGVLPMRGKSTEGGVSLRYVYPDSPAASAGLKAGDLLISFGGQKVERTGSMFETLQTLSPGESVAVEVKRGDETLLVNPQLGTLPEMLPGKLPPAYQSSEPAPAAAAGPQVGSVPIKLPEFENECVAYVPADYTPDAPHGLIVWLHAPGGFDEQDLIALWKPLCEQYGFILLAPKSGEKSKWQPTEARIIRRFIDAATKTYSIDPARVVLHGHEGGGAMAYLVGLTNLDIVRAVAVVDAPLPRLSRLPQPEPVHRLAFYTTLATKTERTKAVEAGIEQLREAKYPVVVEKVGEQARYLTPAELEALVQWFDSLDRI